MTRDASPYDVVWTGPGKRALRALPDKVATAAVEFIYGPLATNPQRVGHALRLKLDGLHSARRGDHRILYRIDDAARCVVIHAIEHRSDIYRRR